MGPTSGNACSSPLTNDLAQYHYIIMLIEHARWNYPLLGYNREVSSLNIKACPWYTLLQGARPFEEMQLAQ
jgi:hypothetical protein